MLQIKCKACHHIIQHSCRAVSKKKRWPGLSQPRSVFGSSRTVPHRVNILPCRPCHPCRRRGHDRHRCRGFVSAGASVMETFGREQIGPAMLAAFCSALRVTFFGSTTPAFTRSSYSPVATIVTFVAVLRFLTSCTMSGPASTPALRGERTQQAFDGALDNVHADLLVVVSRLW